MQAPEALLEQAAASAAHDAAAAAELLLTAVALACQLAACSRRWLEQHADTGWSAVWRAVAQHDGGALDRWVGQQAFAASAAWCAPAHRALCGGGTAVHSLHGRAQCS